jgi:hypothetical protein
MGTPVLEPAGWDVARLDQLSEDDVLIAIGTAFVSPTQRLDAIARSYAPAESLERFTTAGLVGDDTVDLLALGRNGIEEVLASLDAKVRDEICRLLRTGGDWKEVMGGIAAVLAGSIAFHGVPILGIAYVLVRYRGKKLCEGYENQAVQIAPAKV